MRYRGAVSPFYRGRVEGVLTRSRTYGRTACVRTLIPAPSEPDQSGVSIQ